MNEMGSGIWCGIIFAISAVVGFMAAEKPTKFRLNLDYFFVSLSLCLFVFLSLCLFLFKSEHLLN
jgi:hypothetical protein